MNQSEYENIPLPYKNILDASLQSGFTMASDIATCSLLRTLAATKPRGKFLELGTGTGLGTSWILDGMDKGATLISVDNDETFLSIASKYLAADSRLSIVTSDGGEWITNNIHHKFDFIFADTWHGKYLMLDEILSTLNEGGLYIIDDMMPQSNWPAGHDEKALALLNTLKGRNDIFMTNLTWSTGVVVCAKK